MSEQKVWTKEEIRKNMELSDKWLVRGIMAIYSKQTATEQASEATMEDNGIGFSGADATILSSFAKQYQERGFLTSKQLSIARNKMLKYSRQLADISNGKI